MSTLGWINVCVHGCCVSVCLQCKLEAEIERLKQELHDAGDGDTWRESCKRLDAEIERLTRERDEVMRQAREFQTDAKRVGDRIDEQDAEIEKLKAELLFVAAESEKQDEEIERLRADLGIASACVADYVAQRDEARDAATQCYRRFRGTITGRAILKRWPWLEKEGEG